MPATATIRQIRISPRQAGEVVALVKGRSIADAYVILEHTPRRAAVAVKQALRSAAANAQHNHSYKPDGLYITEISVTPGPRLKRFRAVARGTAHRFQRPTSHIRVVVDGDKRAVKRPTPGAKKEAKL
ncbi:50S ribosomal protein L22 [Candidatus Saccharibacteria bacterium]|nr:50S ribosomal protein L22 [Candidatus Saccharibacteria bacterium]